MGGQDLVFLNGSLRRGRYMGNFHAVHFSPADPVGQRDDTVSHRLCDSFGRSMDVIGEKTCQDRSDLGKIFPQGEGHCRCHHFPFLRALYGHDDMGQLQIRLAIHRHEGRIRNALESSCLSYESRFHHFFGAPVVARDIQIRSEFILCV